MLAFAAAVIVTVIPLAAIAAPNGSASPATTTTLTAQAEQKRVCQFSIANSGDIPDECFQHF